MKYVLIVDKKVQEIMPEYIADFPGVPAKERYAPYFLEQCFIAEDNLPVEVNWDFFQLSQTFKEPIRMLSSELFEIKVGQETIIPISFNIEGSFMLDSELTIFISESNIIVTPTIVGAFDVTIYFTAADERTAMQFIKIVVV